MRYDSSWMTVKMKSKKRSEKKLQDFCMEIDQYIQRVTAEQPNQNDSTKINIMLRRVSHIISKYK